MPSKLRDTNYGLSHAARRHAPTQPAPAPKAAPPPKPAPEKVIPSATKAAVEAETKRAKQAQLEAKEAAVAAKAAEKPQTMSTGPIPSPFDVLDQSKKPSKT
jgi:hypothetical protein